MCTKLLLCKDLVDLLRDSLQDEALLSEPLAETASLTLVPEMLILELSFTWEALILPSVGS